ncbi:extracellular solute-binding protein [bacterium]|nr:extracellular solute-binding protein [bacterium]
MPDARAVLGAVASGKAQVGLVYTTEVRTAENVQVVLSIPDAEQPKIIYASAIPADSRRPRMAAEFLRYVYSPWGITAFRRHGFTLPEGPPE